MSLFKVISASKPVRIITKMDITTVILIGVPVVVWLWLSLIGTIAAKYDSTLDPFQKKAQILITWIFPYIGASIIVYLVNQHSPEVIPRNWIPWPFRNLIFGWNQ